MAMKSPEINVFEAGLERFLKLEGRSFFGSQALEQIAREAARSPACRPEMRSVALPATATGLFPCPVMKSVRLPADRPLPSQEEHRPDAFADRSCCGR